MAERTRPAVASEYARAAAAGRYWWICGAWALLVIHCCSSFWIFPSCFSASIALLTQGASGLPFSNVTPKYSCLPIVGKRPTSVAFESWTFAM